MEGQIWRYQTRPGEEASRLFIARIDHGLSSQPIYHIYLDGLKLRNPLMAGGVQETLPFAPVSREAIEASVTELLQSDAAMPDVSEGYAAWLRAYAGGQDGVFTLTGNTLGQHTAAAFNGHK